MRACMVLVVSSGDILTACAAQDGHRVSSNLNLGIAEMRSMVQYGNEYKCTPYEYGILFRIVLFLFLSFQTCCSNVSIKPTESTRQFQNNPR